MPVPHHSIFYGLDALPDAQPTVSKHRSEVMLDIQDKDNLLFKEQLVIHGRNVCVCNLTPSAVWHIKCLQQ